MGWVGMLSIVLAPFAAVPLAWWLGRRAGAWAGWALAAVPLSVVLWVVRQLPLQPGEAPTLALPWAPQLGVSLAFRLDGLAAVFTLLVAGIGALVVVYAGSYLLGDTRRGRLLGTLMAFMGAMLGLVLADDPLTLFVFWELTSVCSYLLVGFDHETTGSRAAALKALLVTATGGLAMLAGLVVLSIAAGQLGLAEVRLSQLATVDLRGHPSYLAALLLVLAGAFTKSAQAPFHFWLPAAMAAPTPVSAYLHSATMVKAGIFLLARLHPALGGTPEWHAVVTVAGLATMLLGAGLTLAQHDMKRILAYSTVAVLGILTMLLGIGTELAIKGAVVFLVAHALYKAALFMVAGCVDHAVGTRDVSVLSGLRRAMPLTATAGLLAALSMAGAPPLFGFIGKELLYKAKLDVVSVGGWLVLAAVLANAAMVAAAILVSVRPFLGPARPTPQAPHEAPFAMWLGPLVLAALGLGVGLLPQWFDATLGSPMASAIVGAPVEMKLALWHGVNLDALAVLGLSAVTLALGLVAYRLARRHLASLVRGVTRLGRWGPSHLFDASVEQLPSVAAALTRRLHSGVLRHALLTVIVVFLALVGPRLWHALRVSSAALGPRPQAHELAIAGLVLAGAVLCAVLPSRLGAVAALGLAGLGITVLFALFGAPDLALTQVMVESLSVLLLVLVFLRVPPVRRRSTRATRGRDAAIALAVGAVMAGLVLAAAAALHLTTDAADFFLAASAPQANGRNVVNVILVDFRALDTLGEISVVLTAGAGVAVLLRRRAGPPEGGSA